MAWPGPARLGHQLLLLLIRKNISLPSDSRRNPSWARPEPSPNIAWLELSEQRHQTNGSCKLQVASCSPVVLESYLDQSFDWNSSRPWHASSSVASRRLTSLRVSKLEKYFVCSVIGNWSRDLPRNVPKPKTRNGALQIAVKLVEHTPQKIHVYEINKRLINNAHRFRFLAFGV